jgi:hypothetical protein
MNTLTTLGIVAGSVVVFVLAVSDYRNNRKMDANELIGFFISIIGFVGGIKTVIFSFSPNLSVLANKEEVDISYIALGGVSLIIVTGLAGLRSLGARRKRTRA